MIEDVFVKIIASISSDVISQSITAVVSAITTAVLGLGHIPGFLSQRKFQQKDRKELIEKMVADGNLYKKHDFILEDNFRDLFKVNPEASVIRYLFSLKHPTKKLFQFSKGFQFFKIDKDKEGNVTGLELTKNLENKIRYRLTLLREISLYVGLVFLGLAPLLFFSNVTQDIINKTGFPFLIGLTFWVVGCLMGSILSLRHAVNMMLAKELVTSLKSEQPDPA